MPEWSLIIIKLSWKFYCYRPRLSMMPKMTLSSTSSIRSPQCPPSPLCRMRGIWHTYNHARKLKLWKQVNNFKSMVSTITSSSMSPVRKYHHLQRPPFRKGVLDKLYKLQIEYKKKIHERWPYHPSFQSGTITFLHVPNRGQGSWQNIINNHTNCQ